MYKSFFGLAKDPFVVSPDPYFLFRTAETDETYARLLDGVRARKGLILLVGEVGTGKTLLIRKLIEQIHDEATAIAFVFNPRMNVTEFLDYVLSDFGIEHDSKDRLRMFETLQEWLLGRNLKGQTSVLIIDEAQNLTTEVFEVVRALSNLETPTEELLQIILSGQREIEGTLSRPELKPVTQRISLRLRTCPLSSAETLQYIAHRLRVAGGNVETVFTPEAGMAVSWSSAGIPRLINLICEHALISGYANQRKPVGAKTIWEVARQFALGVPTWAEEALADEGLGPLETGALTPQITEITNLAGPPPQPAPIRVSPESHETAMPIGTQTYAGTSAEVSMTPLGEGSVKAVTLRAPTPTETPPRVPKVISQPREEQVSERVAVQPFPAIQPAEVPKSWGPQMPVAIQAPSAMKKGAASPEFAPINDIPPQPARERLGTLQWASLALISMGVVLGGYYLIGGSLLMKTSRGEPPNSRSQLLTSGKSPTDNLAGPHTPSPSARNGVTGQEQAPKPPATSVPGGKAGQVTAIPAKSAKEELPSGSPRLPSRFTPESSEVKGPYKQATLQTTAPPPPPTPGQLAVTSNVPGATIAVDGRSDPTWTTPHMFTDFSPGVYSIVVSKQGYKEAQQSVTVEAGRETSVNATLTPPRGEIAISTRPPGAEVLIDGKSYGPGPVRAEVDAGQHTFLVRQAGREPVEGKLVVQDQAVVQQTIDLPLKPLIPPVMNIAVNTNPPSATVYVDGALMSGKTPTSFHLSPGHHTLIIFAAGYRPVRRDIDVPEDGTLTVNATLSGQ